jgi:hypothetical protein
MHTPCSTQPILHDLTFTGIITFDARYNSWGSSLYSFVHPPVTSALRSKYPPQHFVLKHPESSVLRASNYTRLWECRRNV